MKFLSWNVNSFKACWQKGLPKVIQAEKPDFVLLQETKTSPEKLNAQEKSLGQSYHSFWASAQRPGYSGVASFSLQEPKTPSFKLGDERFDQEGRVLVLEEKDFFLINAYFPHSRRELSRLRFKLNFDEKFADFCQKLEKKKPLIIGGDFNVAHQAIDIARPKDNQQNAGFTMEERAWLTSFLSQGYLDTFREFVSDGGHYTWWSYRYQARQRNIGWRIDYFLISQVLKKRMKKAQILDQISGSDHCPIILELE
jgi:exodeoxyribonuclease III